MNSDTFRGISSHCPGRLARTLFDAFETGISIEPLTATDPELSVADAYDIQREVVALHAAAGRAVCGRKIGLTNPVIQRQLGVDSPDFGVLLDAFVFPSGAHVSRAALHVVAPRIEPEVAFVLSCELRGPGISASDVTAATAAVRPVFELIDSRVVDWRIRLADTIADNASCLGAVLGAEIDPALAGPAARLQVAMSRDGDVLERGRGDAVMGDPAAAVAWLANELSGFGETLAAGQPILAGSFTAAIDATPGTYRADFGETLGAVEIVISD
jgi:2-keto-4-pentenoate hydratase